jgi:hypothetical protein
MTNNVATALFNLLRIHIVGNVTSGDGQDLKTNRLP